MPDLKRHLINLKISSLNDLANRELVVQANGSVKLGKGGVYITKPFDYSGKHKVDFKL